MKNLILLPLICLFAVTVSAQIGPDYSKIDMMLVRGDYKKVIDTCNLILKADSMNAVIHFKTGLAYQNMLPDEKSFEHFLTAASLDTVNQIYRFTVGKAYFNKNKYSRAKPLFEHLCKLDSLNWTYAFYLTSIYQDEGRTEKCIAIYNRFHSSDSSNYVFLDKLGYAYLLKGQYQKSIDYYTRSLKINEKNINAIKNLSFLYPYVQKIDTAIILLNRAIELDPEDMDLYARRATIYLAKHYNKKMLDDYLRILASGDTTFLYLKRAGIGYVNNMQPKKALPFLLLASSLDTTDYETLNNIAGCYEQLNDLKKAGIYYEKIIVQLSHFTGQLGIVHMMAGHVYKNEGLYPAAIENYEKSLLYLKNMNLNLMIANIYDEFLNNSPRAIHYYRQYIAGNQKEAVPGYLESVMQRLTYLEEKQKEQKKTNSK